MEQGDSPQVDPGNGRAKLTTVSVAKLAKSSARRVDRLLRVARLANRALFASTDVHFEPKASPTSLPEDLPPAPRSAYMVPSGKVICIDQKFEPKGSGSSEKHPTIATAQFVNHVLIRPVAIRIRFSKVDFRYTTFDSGYLRDCVFEGCDFTGCRFISTNCEGSRFAGCKFEYAVFERTNIDSAILGSECPVQENLKMRFARTLRMNYSQIGDADAVNEAIKVELAATGEHYRRAWSSKEDYYRRKYKGLERANYFAKSTAFSTLDAIWGNGESPLRLVRTLLLFLVSLTLFDVAVIHPGRHFSDLGTAFKESAQAFMGIAMPKDLVVYSICVTAFRLMFFGLFLSIVAKRLSRR